MGFITKIDSSNNRQIIQNILTQSYYSGSTILGTSFSQLPSGVNLNQTGITSSFSSVTSTYTANTTASTMQVTFGNPNMAALSSGLTVITTANTGTTQYLGPSFSATSSTTIDNNTVNLAWSGVSYTFQPVYNELSGTTLYGTASSVVYTYTGGTLDYTGRTIWSDVKGLSRADVIILNEGLIKGDEDVSTNANTNSVILGGSGNTFNTGVKNAVILGTTGVTATTSDFAYTNNLKITNKLGINRIPDYSLDLQSSNGRLYYNNSTAELPYLQISATTDSMPYIGVSEASAGAGTVIGIRGGTNGSYPAYGKVLDSFLYSTVNSNGLNIISAPGTGTEDYIRLYAGQQANAASPDVHVQGSGATRGYVGIGTDTPTKNLDVNGELRVRTVGAGPGTSIAVDGSGNVVYTASDIKLKENIEVIESALDKVLKLRGVTFNWKDRDKGGNQKEIGFIAQEVQKINPELVFEVPNSDILAVKYENTVALLVEAIKEMDNKIINIDELAQLELLLPKSEYIPTSSNDTIGGVNSVVRDDNFLYIKTENGWVRTKLEKF